MKKIEMVFYKTKPSEKNTGLKYVLWEIQVPGHKPDSCEVEYSITHDWGFASWDGKEWEAIDVPNGYTAEVIWWANTVNPELLLKEPSKIISLR